MLLNKDRQSFTKAVVILIALQGLAWVGLAITGIIVHSSPPVKLKHEIHTYTRYVDYLARIIYDDFMGGVRDRVIRPADFVAFLWIYLIFSALWVAASFDQYAAVRYNKMRQSMVTLVLGVIVLVTSVIDLVFVSLLARDFHTCPFNLAEVVTTTTAATPAPAEGSLTLSQSFSLSLRNTGSTSNGTAIDCQLANGIIMTIAARGFVLWLINVILAISMITIGAKALRTPPLLTYGKNTIPRVRAPELRKQPSANDIVYLGDDNVFPPPPPPQQNGRYRDSTPVSLTNKNQNMYY